MFRNLALMATKKCRLIYRGGILEGLLIIRLKSQMPKNVDKIVLLLCTF